MTSNLRHVAFVVALVVLASSACGKYGPPVRTTPNTSGVPAAKPQPVSAAPVRNDGAAGNTEECADPNAPGAGAATTAGTTP